MGALCSTVTLGTPRGSCLDCGMAGYAQNIEEGWKLKWLFYSDLVHLNMFLLGTRHMAVRLFIHSVGIPTMSSIVCNISCTAALIVCVESYSGPAIKLSVT